MYIRLLIGNKIETMIAKENEARRGEEGAERKKRKKKEEGETIKEKGLCTM